MCSGHKNASKTLRQGGELSLDTSIGVGINARVALTALRAVYDQGFGSVLTGSRMRLAIDISFDEGGSAEGLVYIATEDNTAFLGEAPEREIARQIAASAGPSGRKRDYLTDLADALRALGKDDPHVLAVERHLAEFD